MNKTKDVIFPLRLLCLDIDGTLLDTAHQLPPENRAAVQYAAEKGVCICLLSARPPQGNYADRAGARCAGAGGELWRRVDRRGRQTYF